MVEFRPSHHPWWNVYLLLNSVTFFQVGSMRWAPVCQPCRCKAQGFQAGNGTHSNSGSFLTWLTPRRWAHSTVRLIIAVEQTNTCRLQVSALDDFCRKWWVWNHSTLVWHEGYILSAAGRVEKKVANQDRKELVTNYKRAVLHLGVSGGLAMNQGRNRY